MNCKGGQTLKEALTKPAFAMAILGLAVGSSVLQSISAAAGKERLYIGTYTSAKSVGIYESGLDLGTGVLATNLPAQRQVQGGARKAISYQ